MTVTGKENLNVQSTAEDEAKKREAAAAFEAYVMAQEAKRSKPRRRLPPGTLSVGAILLMVLAVWVLTMQVQAPGGNPGAVTPASAPAGTFVPTLQPVPGGLQVTWGAIEGADQYVAVVLDENLSEIHRSAPVAGTTVALASTDLPAPPRGGFVQVVALIMDVEIESSPLVPLPLPR